MDLDHNLIFYAETLWRTVVTEIGANHALGKAIWLYKLYHNEGEYDKAAQYEKELRLMIAQINKQRAAQMIAEL